MWSGDIVNAQYYLPKGSPPTCCATGSPTDGHGMVDNDLMVVLTRRQEPGARPPLPNYMLDAKNALEELRLHRLPAAAERRSTPSGWSPTASCRQNLATAAVCEEYFDVGYRLLELPRRTTPRGTRSGRSSRPVADRCRAPDPEPPAGRRTSRGRCWPAPGAARHRLAGCCSSSRRCTSCSRSCSATSTRSSARRPGLEPDRSGTPTQFSYVLNHIVGEDGFFGPALLRTAVYVLTASVLCLLDRLPGRVLHRRGSPGRWQGLLLAAADRAVLDQLHDADAGLGQPAARTTGWSTGSLSLGGLFDVHVDWLVGPVRRRDPRPGLRLRAVHDPAAVRRPRPHPAVAARGGPRPRRRPVRRRSAGSPGRCRRPAVIASVLLTCLPMLGDYFTNDLLSGSPSTSMVGNLINNSVLTPGPDRPGRARS